MALRQNNADPTHHDKNTFKHSHLNVAEEITDCQEILEGPWEDG